MSGILSGLGGMLSREKVAKAATELAEHLQIIENIRALQIAQKELADEMRRINERLTAVQTEIRAIKAETRIECLKETQQTVYAVQGGLNERMETISNKLAVIDVLNRMASDSLHPPALKKLDSPQLNTGNKKNPRG
jgi:hypothetical protein